MANRPARFPSAEVSRILKGILAAGLKPARMEFQGDKMVIFGEGSRAPEPSSPLAEWKRNNDQD